LVGKRHQVYSGLQGAGVVMESITLIFTEYGTQFKCANVGDRLNQRAQWQKDHLSLCEVT